MAGDFNALIPSTGAAGDFTNWWQPYPYYQPTIYPHVCTPTVVTYTNPQPRCAWCQGNHYGGCARLKSVTYRKDGTVERVEFFDERDGD